MAERNDTPKHGTVEPLPLSQDTRPLRGMQTSALLVDLFQRAAPTLTDQDLRAVGSKADEAACIASEIHTLCEKVGCYVAADGDGGGGRYAGFERRDALSALLFAVGRMADHVDGLLQVSGMAADLRAERRPTAGPAAV